MIKSGGVPRDIYYRKGGTLHKMERDKMYIAVEMSENPTADPSKDLKSSILEISASEDMLRQAMAPLVENQGMVIGIFEIVGLMTAVKKATYRNMR